ncbi:hypothetical protein IHQ56_02675 [Methylobacillus flagellatus]|uniref:VapE domain-containing protein n=1 Tax=Methylobacillus flagellatus TaxID=405 RepID=UPI002853C327|nr:VapE domain-containing protein [Methylobacillus flagellatus]MDR5170714.1 hypothetical protein [Methylobacillus flagellatus]
MAKRPDIPFIDIASRALSCAESLLAQWLPYGKRQGKEWVSTNPLRADSKPGSFLINIDSGSWGDFATDDKGGDLISLYAYLQGISQAEAACDVADMVGYALPEGCRPGTRVERKQPLVDPATVKPKKALPSDWVPILPIPANAIEPPKAHPNRGLPERVFTYRNGDGYVLGYIYRFIKSTGGKETIPLTWCVNNATLKEEWRWMQMPEPRPLYGLDVLAAKPQAWVLLVEGEKCKDAAEAMFPNAVVVSWPGGTNAVKKVNWSHLAGRKVFAWPDCDSQREKLSKEEKEAGVDPLSKPYLPIDQQPGMKAMLQIRDILLELDPDTEFNLLDIPEPGVKADGWDVADAIEEGWDASRLLEYVLTARKAAPEPADTPNSAAAEEVEDIPKWRACLLRKAGEITPCLANIYDILEHDDAWAGVLVYDEFSQRVMKLKPPPYWDKTGKEGEWDAQDDARTAMWLTRKYRFNPSPALVAEAIEALARLRTVNPPKDWLLGLKWDGNKRLDRWMQDFMGVPFDKYSARVARWFFMGMVKRVFFPGCKFDYCLVLEGAQGRRKSSALAVIGGDWYGDTDLDLNNKDSMSALRGKMLYEFSEMGSVARAEATKQKSFLSRQVDEYRPVYGRREIRAPRQLVFAGTTNEWEWNKDPTGGRRFWPVRIEQEIDLEGLAAVRDQLFAEAVQLVNQDYRCYPTTDEQQQLFDPIQLSRAIQDSFIDALYQHVIDHVGEFSLHYAATEWLKLDAGKLTRDVQTRIGHALRQLGCSRHEKRSNAISRFWYKPPARSEAISIKQEPAQESEDVSF